MYATARVGANFVYYFNLPVGQYRVDLEFVEGQYTQVGQRQFVVEIQVSSFVFFEDKDSALVGGLLFPSCMWLNEVGLGIAEPASIHELGTGCLVSRSRLAFA